MFPDRDRWKRRILALDPVADHHEIYRISSGYEFPWDYRRALEFALFRTYCVPSISALLDATGEFRDRAQKRYDDTALLMGELTAVGYDSPRGREALRVINRMHGRYAIDNDDMLYVLTTFIYDPIDWINSYGWRRLTEHETTAAFHFYREVGHRMGIREIPDDFDLLWDFKREYERETFRYADTNRNIGTYTTEMLAGWFPAPLRPAVRVGVRAMLDETMLTAFGLEPAPGWLTRAANTSLRARAAVVRQLPSRRTIKFIWDPRTRTYPGYPKGYVPGELGAPPPPETLDEKWRRKTGATLPDTTGSAAPGSASADPVPDSATTDSAAVAPASAATSVTAETAARRKAAERDGTRAMVRGIGSARTRRPARYACSAKLPPRQAGTEG